MEDPATTRLEALPTVTQVGPDPTDATQRRRSATPGRRDSDRRAAAAGVRLGARLAAAAESGESSERTAASLLPVIAEALAAPMAHLTRRTGMGLAVVAHHGLPGGLGVLEEPWPDHGVAAAVLDGDDRMLVHDARHAASWLDLSGGRARSGIYVAVRDRDGSPTACLGVEDTIVGAFTEDDLELLASLGELLGAVLAGIDRVGKERDRARRERARRRSSEAGAAVVTAGLGHTSVEDAADAMVRAAREVLEWPVTSLVRHAGSSWIVEASGGHVRSPVGQRLPHRGVLTAAFESQRTVVGPRDIDDVLLDERSRARLVSPIRVSGAVRYAVVVEAPDEDALGDEMRGDAAAVAARMGLVLERLELLAVEQQTAERLAEADRLRANLLTIAGHELRTPLTVVLGYAETLRERSDQLTPAQLASATERLVDRAGHLSDLVDRVLLASRLESGAVEMTARDVHLGELLAAADWATGLDVGAGVGTCRVRADADWLSRALSFLVEHCTGVATAPVTLDARTIGDRAAVLVRDDGPGIPGYERERVFRPFAGTGTSDSPVGLGPGLARGLVRGMGGELRLYSAVGYGSTFVVVLPAA